MSLVRGVVAYAFVGLMVGIIWPLVAAPFGPLAGLVAALLIIAPTWYVCHYWGFIPQDDGQIAIDMGTAIGISLLVRVSGAWIVPNLDSSANLSLSCLWSESCRLALC